MNANLGANSVPNVESPPTGVPQVVPHPGVGMGHPEFHFVQGLMEVQKALVEISTNLSHVTKSVDAMKLKVDELAPLPKTVDGIKSKVDDLMQWKTLIIGGAITLGAVLGVGTVALKFGSEYFVLKSESMKVDTKEPAKIEGPPQAAKPVT